MKYAKIFSRAFLAGWLALSISSCSDDFVNLESPQSLDLASTVTDVKSLTNATVGVYNFFQDVNYYNRSFMLVPELMSDNVFISRRNVGFYLNYNNLAVPADDPYAESSWAAMYSVIVNANQAIWAGEKLNDPANQVAINQLVGEMYAARALAHFDLVRLFAKPYNATADASHKGIPIVIGPPVSVITPTRALVREVYDQIISDFLKAISLMQSQKKNGFFTKGAAKALLSKVYLYKEDWANAEKYATEVIETEPYILLTTAQYTSSWAGDFSPESLFEIENIPTDRPAVNGIGFFYEQGAYGDALATADLYNTYSTTDVRRGLIQAGARANAEDPAYIVHKYPKGLTSQDDNIKVIRLSEVYLIRAEARAEQANIAGKTALAQADLNTIVQRADPAALPVTLGGAALVDRILEERRKELAFEGNRLFDLTRKKKDVTHYQSTGSITVNYNDNRLVLPIPQYEININPSI